jgi:hypothetical protein
MLDIFPITPPPSWLDLLYRWQSLAAGLVAVFAAIIPVGGAEIFARLKERRESKVILLSLAVEVRAYLDLFIRKREVIRRLSQREALREGPVLGRDLKTVVELPAPIIFPVAADRIGLLGPRMAAGLAEFYATQDGLNLAVRAAAIDPDKAIDRDKIGDLTHLFERACLRALPLLAKLPHDKANVALKKTIESFA